MIALDPTVAGSFVWNFEFGSLGFIWDLVFGVWDFHFFTKHVIFLRSANYVLK
jgi:hypothetical protein